MKYAGNELEVFQNAVFWKRYVKSCCDKYMQGDVLEVGAGLGSYTNLLDKRLVRSWLAVEPDVDLYTRLESNCIQTGAQDVNLIHGTIRDVPKDKRFDSIVYIDVLEHIKDDQGELAKASEHLKNGGRLIILVPAHQRLYSGFDKSIGHYRRYNLKVLSGRIPEGLKIQEAKYLDSLGFLLAVINRLFKLTKTPSKSMVTAYDRVLARNSPIADKLLGYRLGKSLFVCAEKRA